MCYPDIVTMSRQAQDSVIDDDEETCPLCIEEFDLSDKNFRPCPCGYQVRLMPWELKYLLTPHQRYANSVSTVSRRHTRRVLVLIVDDLMMKRPSSIRSPRPRSSSKTSKTKTRNIWLQDGRRLKSARSKHLPVEISLACVSSR